LRKCSTSFVVLHAKIKITKGLNLCAQTFLGVKTKIALTNQGYLFEIMKKKSFRMLIFYRRNLKETLKD